MFDHPLPFADGIGNLKCTTFVPKPISLIVTTHRTDSLYTQACLESIRRWKNWHHELIVVVHDESALLRAYLESCADERLIDKLLFTAPGHGHTRSFNLAADCAKADVIFNIANDILIGPSLVDDCAFRLRTDTQLGLIGWHWSSNGTRWTNGKITEYTLRDPQKPNLAPEREANIRRAPWFTGRFFNGIGGAFWLKLCNTGFFGVRRDVLNVVGGGFGQEYRHYWADDFLNYAVLDQGLDVRPFDQRFKRREYFHEFQYDQTDVQDRRRHDDSIRLDAAFQKTIRLIHGGMSEEESTFLYLLARAIPDGATVTNVGVWKGASAIILMDALRSKQVRFHFVDCFDLPGISKMSAQPPVKQCDFMANIAPYVGPKHEISIYQANTLQLDSFPKSDFIFVDAGHTKECITHDAKLAHACLTKNGIGACPRVS